jgi:aminoglycoside phosphotransferase (APT) family kinase protein
VPVKNQAYLDEFLYNHGLARPGETARWSALTGGVSSEIWRVELPGRDLCVKRALLRLKVAGDWSAPISRNTYEWRWLCFAAEHWPQSVPRPLAHDAKSGLFAMSFLAPEQYPVWKSQLLAGIVIPSFAAQVGVLLAHFHNTSVNRPDLANEFASLENFHSLRIEPYLLATAVRHPDLAGRLQAIAHRTSGIALALVHGDISPKNILVGAKGPVVLDAECAWYGDPAFDIAFCLNHLLLKSLVRPDCTSALLQSFSQLAESYFDRATVESRLRLEARVLELLPALMLARVDGRSPVEYLSGKTEEQDLVRRVARSLLNAPVEHLAMIPLVWAQEMDGLRRVNPSTLPSQVI